jgi:hypothetical protein
MGKKLMNSVFRKMSKSLHSAHYESAIEYAS